MKPIIALLALSLPLYAATTINTDDPESYTAAAPPTVEEGPSMDAYILFNQGRHESGVTIARPLAEKGDPDALFLLGFAAETGQGMDASRDSALESYRLAAAKGHKEATYRRALILLNTGDEEERKQGTTVLEDAAKTDPKTAGRMLGEAWLRGLISEKPDTEKAILWWKRASDAGDDPSLLLLARLYSGEFGFPEIVDAEKSISFFSKAAGLGQKAAYLPLGSRLLNGEESTRNEEQGREWLDKAIKEDIFAAYLVLGDHEENIKKNDKAAYGFYLKGAEAEQPDCMLRLASLLFNGRGTEKSEDKAREWLEKAVKAGSALAAYELAGIYANEENPDTLKVYSYLVLAASSGIPNAQNELGLLYLTGNLGSSDKPAAVAWFTKSAQAGYSAAQNNLATLYEGGIGVPVNYGNAGELYSLAANQGHPAATASLARMYAAGIGTEPNLVKAWAFASLAIEYGDKDAKANLDKISEQLTPELLAEAKKELEQLKSPSAPDKAEDENE
ncbi:MAG: tetratricopeptide repeat protein [Luteolibacter sp.]